jgi:hypothetical protein
MLSLTSLHDYHHVTLFALSKYLIVLFFHQVIVFFYPCRLKTQSTFICLSLPFASKILPFAFQCGVLSKWYTNSLTQIGMLLYETKIHHHLNIKTSRFKKGPNQDLESSYVDDYGLALQHVCFFGCHP